MKAVVIWHTLEANSIPDEAVSIIFAADKANVDSDISNSFPWYSSLDEVRQGVVVDVVFNMGLPRFKHAIYQKDIMNYPK